MKLLNHKFIKTEYCDISVVFLTINFIIQTDKLGTLIIINANQSINKKSGHSTNLRYSINFRNQDIWARRSD